MDLSSAGVRGQLRLLMQGSFGVPLLLLTVLAMMTLPVPPILLDVLFSFNIALSLVVLLVAVYAMRPLDFAVFPTILLITTLLRLALNVASTRVVLLEGHTGADAAGKVIESFGNVVIGGNYVVGMVVFLILIIINFVVVTKGAGRISEVSARFTLDAMPGKQMAIDADLNAGQITQEEARLRREEVSSEADFYGAMDGASKFVRGDAVAGMLILAINLIGGLAIGVMQHDMEFAVAMQRYSLLTIGDGLVAQIPSLLLSTTAAIMVTRVNSARDMGDQVLQQMFESPRAVTVAAIVLLIMGLVPGMPHLAFLVLAALAGGCAWYIRRRIDAGKQRGMDVAQMPRPSASAPVELGWDDVALVDMIGLEVGYRLIPMVDKAQGGALLGRIKGVRKKLSQEMGFLVPAVHIRDNLELLPNAYRIQLMGVTMGEAEVYPERELAINPGQVFGRLEGLDCRDPAFGLDAVWIDRAQHERAQTLGYTVVDSSTVIATHLNQVLLDHIGELLGHEETEQLLQKLARISPK
ncbi:MAG: flagellar biosynthesis protein FlhA, partial [Pseudomonadales bacterium]|nr:flagellar biosynthesis protein FlhA [Pseudomonadales bacterium]